MQKIRLFHWFICSGDMDNSWLRAFRPISQEQKFSQTCHLHRKTANNIYFHYTANSVKTKDQFFQSIQKTLFLAQFWSILQILGAKKKRSGKSALSYTTSYGFLAPCQNLEKTKDTIPRKCLDRPKDGRMEWKDEQALLHQTLLPTSTTAVDHI